MNLYILRHGIAVERGTPGFTFDSQRPLTSEGRRKLRRISRALQQLDLSFDVILSSPFTRARQTAEIVAANLNLNKKLKFTEALAPATSRVRLIREINSIRPSPNDVLLVGHEPSLSELISLLLCGDADCTILLKKGGLCKLSVERRLIAGQCACLECLLTPRQLVRMV